MGCNAAVTTQKTNIDMLTTVRTSNVIELFHYVSKINYLNVRVMLLSRKNSHFDNACKYSSLEYVLHVY